MDGTGVEEDVVEARHVGPVFDLAADHHVADAALEAVAHPQRPLRFELCAATRTNKRATFQVRELVIGWSRPRPFD